MLRRHRGFTLIELLVVMALIIVLLGLAVAFNNSATMDSYKVVGAGDRLAQALITAKSRAARDRAPRGIRLVADSRGFIQELYYIEQPEPWLPDQSNSLKITALPKNLHRSQLAVMYPTQQQVPPYPTPYTYPKPLPTSCFVYLVLNDNVDPSPDPIDAASPQATDYQRFMQMFVPGQVHIASSPDLSAAFAFDQITPVSNADSLQYGAFLESVPDSRMRVLRLNVTRILNPDLACGESPTPPSGAPRTATIHTRNFGIYLPAKPLAGEPSLTLSKTAAVDTTASLPHFTPYMQGPTTRHPNTLRSGESIDILFSPSGHVMYYAEGVLAFLIRDIQRPALLDATPVNNNRLTDPTVGQQNYSNAGEMILVAVFPRTGTVVTKPVAEPRGANPDPYQYAKDAINSGL